MKLKIGFKSGNVVELEFKSNDAESFMARVDQAYNQIVKTNAVASRWISASECIVFTLTDIEFIAPSQMVIARAEK